MMSLVSNEGPTPSVPIAPRPQNLAQPAAPGGFDALGQGDFLRLLVTQLEQQDPFDPVDNKDMLAQMAQFSSLAGTTETNDTLQQILARLDALAAAQSATQSSTQSSGQSAPSNPNPIIDQE